MNPVDSARINGPARVTPEKFNPAYFEPFIPAENAAGSGSSMEATVREKPGQRNSF